MCSRVIASIKNKHHSLGRSGALCAIVALSISSAALAQTTGTLSVAQVLQLHQRALAISGGKAPQTLETIGTLHGADLNGSFHIWHDADHDRVDQNLGVRVVRTLRLGDRQYEQNSSGDVIELKGLLLQRSRTQDFITSSDLFDQPQYSTLLGRSKLSDGRDVYQLRVSPPGGEVETIDIDAQTYLLDRMEYIDGDGLFTVDFSDYRPVNGYMFSFKQLQSDGDHPYDVTQITTKMIPNAKIDAATFARFVPAQLQSSAPVIVPIEERNGALYSDVVISGHTFKFLIDSGAQGVVLSSGVAGLLGLIPEGSFEARGTARTGGIGVARLNQLHIGAATLPVGAVSILDLNGSTQGRFAIDGILGFPLFGASTVQIDYAKKTMTIAPPGMLALEGTRFEVDTDRELTEMMATVNGTEGRFLVDTGNGNELLLFHSFLDSHRGLLPFTAATSTSSYGVGGATRAIPANVDELDMGPFRLFHRYASVILSDEGAFADRFDAGNIGLGVLKNFVVTFDVPNRAIYLARGAGFDDGRERQVVEGASHWH